MAAERLEAVVARGVDFSESSRIVTLITPDRGRMSCMAAGARRPRSGFASLLDTFNRIEAICYVKDTRSVQKLGEGSLLYGYPGVKSDLDKSLYAAFLLELTAKSVQEDEPAGPSYDALVAALDGLETLAGAVTPFAAAAGYWLLSAAGLAPEIPPAGQRPTGFSFDTGVSPTGRDATLSPDAWALMQALSTGRVAAETDEAASVEVFDALAGYAARQLETSFRSLRVIRQMTQRP